MPTPTWIVESVAGDVDLASAPELRARLKDLIDPGPTFVVLDLSELVFIDSTGLGVLVGVHRRVKEAGGEVRLASAGPRIMRVLSVTGLDRVFVTFPTVAEAIQASPEDGQTGD